MIACLGPAGSYSSLVASKMARAGAGDLLLCPTFSAVMESLEEGRADSAVLPVENSIRGGVMQNLDLLENADVYAVQEAVEKIDHRLAMLQGVSPEQVERIYSHEQAIGQCSGYLRRRFPEAQYVCTPSTAKSLELLDGRSAGIVGSHIRKDGVVLSEDNIADEKDNFTRFFRLVPRRAGLPNRSEKIFFCAVTAHRPRALLGFLEAFEAFNLTRIVSCPIKNEFGQYRFFIEFLGDIGDVSVRSALERAEAQCLQFRLIGAY